MLRKAIKLFCSDSATHLRETLRKCQALEQEISVNNEKLTSLKEEFSAQEKKLSLRNKQIFQLRTQLTNDIKKGQQLWSSARNKSQKHRNQSIRNFAASLTKLIQPLKEVKSLEKETHQVDIKQGFDLTSRLFFSILEKYKILTFEPALKTKFNKEQMIVEGEVKAENEKDKGLVAKVNSQGYKVEDKIIHKAKVLVYN